MSAERGWIGDPQVPKKWHTPGWVKTGGRHFVAPPPQQTAPGAFPLGGRFVCAQNVLTACSIERIFGG